MGNYNYLEEVTADVMEAIKENYEASEIIKRLDAPDVYLAEAIKALKAYTEQQQRIIA